MRFELALFAALLSVGTAALAQTKWDLPAAYPAGNFHTENIVQFAKDVEAATAGKLKITVHANASLITLFPGIVTSLPDLVMGKER